MAAIGSAWAATSAMARRGGGAAGAVTLSIVGTTDLHGAVFDNGGRGGLALLGGYVGNLRAARAADQGAVLLIDAGDTYQGGIESNLSEGALVVDAYNALGYTAAALGNHEFDFGPVDVGGRRVAADADPRGALKAIAARARFPVLAANLVDAATGRVVDWPNVRPSALVDAAGVKVGLVGVMTIDALGKTLVVNARGLAVTPLAAAIESEATALRARGAEVVVVAAHAGGRCQQVDDQADLSSCDDASEIFQVARALPHGLVNAIVAGHAHAGVAHVVNGIAITESYSHGRAFGRIDLSFDRRQRAVTAARVFAPRHLCARENPHTRGCDPTADAGPYVPVEYEGRPVVPDPAVTEAMAPALAEVRRLQAMPLGAHADTPLERRLQDDSPLGNLFADALRDSVPGADVAVVNSSARGGLRADLPRGPLTFGLLYDVFPFDNQVARLEMTGAQLARVLQVGLERNRSFALGISGARVGLECVAGGTRLMLARASGQSIADDEPLVVVTTEMLAAGALFAPVMPPGGFVPSFQAPVAREVVADWIRRRDRLSAAEFTPVPLVALAPGAPACRGASADLTETGAVLLK